MGRRIGAWARFGAALMLVGAAAACTGGSDETGDAMVQDSLTYLALGDSYTIGEAVDSASRWPVLLAAALRERGVPVKDPAVVARTGWTTDELDAAMDAQGLAGSWELVSLLIGVNNQYRGRSAAEYREQLSALLGRAVALAGGDASRVLVLSIPDWGVTPFAEGRDRATIAGEIDTFNRIKEEEAASLGAVFVDITGISREASSDPSLVAEDGLHPSADMYARWVQEALPAVMAMLGSGDLR